MQWGYPQINSQFARARHRNVACYNPPFSKLYLVLAWHRPNNNVIGQDNHSLAKSHAQTGWLRTIDCQ